jgi:hypothetical protein
VGVHGEERGRGRQGRQYLRCSVDESGNNEDERRIEDIIMRYNGEKHEEINGDEINQIEDRNKSAISNEGEYAPALPHL